MKESKLINLLFGFCILLISVPFNYFFENNFNALPIQFLLCCIVTILFFKLNLKNTFFYFFSFLVLITVSDGNIKNLTFSAVTASFLFYWLILAHNNLKLPQTRLNNIVNISLFYIAVLLIYYSFDFYLNNDFQFRSKGFGSGTVFSLIALYGFCAIYLRYNSKNLSLINFIPLSLVFIIPILITQSRGVLVTFIFVIIFVELKSLKKFKLRRFLLFLLFFGYIIFNSNIMNRFDFSYYEDVDHLTSNRLPSQQYIYESFVTETNWINILFGNGLKSVNNILHQQKGFEFPHFDILFSKI